MCARIKKSVPLKGTIEATINLKTIHSLIEDELSETPLAVTLLPFGHNSVTYEVVTPSKAVILRTNTNPKVFQHTQSNL